MNILLVSCLFPPHNNIGAVRTGKTAAYLRRFGHDVRVITAASLPLEQTLPLEIPDELVTATPWINVNRPVEALLGGRQRVAASGYAGAAGPGRALLKKLGYAYRSLVNVPDGYIGWLPFATAAAADAVARWRPDVIYASALPATSLLVAAETARRFDIPWIAELRDLWVDDYSYPHPAWRRWIEDRWERQVLGSARALVTVSEPLAEQLRARYDQPLSVVLNGFDPQDSVCGPRQSRADEPLRIVYTGMIYEGRRDPTPLFAALRLLGDEAQCVRVQFYGRYLQSVERLAAEHGVARSVEVLPNVAYAESLRLQRQADVLLLLLWTDARQRGVFTGKLFEYLGARRPTLAIGPHADVAGELVVERQAGACESEPGAIAARLRAWIAEKRATGRVADLPASVVEGLSREEQILRLEAFLLETVGGARRRWPRLYRPLRQAA